jgi:glycosyltransferase involved in cell wall biosynthesis
VVYFSEGAIWKQQYERLLRTSVHLVASPIGNCFLDPELLPFVSAREKARIVYCGGARINKGFDVSAQVLKALLADEECKQKIFAQVQVDIHEMQSAPELAAVNSSVKALETLAAENKNLELIRGALKVQEYYALLGSCDIVLLLYRRAFQSAPSRIFREAIVMGKIPIVSARTTMAAALETYSCAELVCEISDPSGCARAVKNAIANLPEIRRKLSPLRALWAKEYSISAMVDTLISLAK